MGMNEVRSKTFMEDKTNRYDPPVAADVSGRRFVKYTLTDKDIREDMHWVYLKNGEPVHTDDFTLSKVGEDSVEKAIEKDLDVIRAIEKDLGTELAEDALIARFKALANGTALFSISMAENNRDMIEAFADKKLADNPAENPPLQIGFSTLEKKVFASSKGKEFIKAVEEAFAKRIGDIVALNGDIHAWEPLDDNTIVRPEFSRTWNNINGLKFAVNQVYQYDVYVNGLRYCGDKTYEADMEYILYDHFGLDYNDIAAFGTKEKVVESNKLLKFVYMLKPDITLPVLAVLGGAGLIAAIPLAIKAAKSKSEEDKKLAKRVGIPSAVALALSLAGIWVKGAVNAAAPGFRAWFILQHYRAGYRPFVTEMRCQKTFQFKLK